ncbi:hypothetical protein K2173_017147 [Erythroxylum novogranatense]|uniref:Ninja-family protein n=1 Tax=Erythroxylum novogranatense TaxID=1862640 RepID=A0AAV8U5U7_9ROSI|nr:hypothetical protein K2173_017147 [Erythroxylum novogranatense]
MGDGNENENRGSSSNSSRAMERLSLEISRYPRDLLQRFMPSDKQKQSTLVTEEEDKNEIELNLGLSLGGRFGVDKTTKRGLTRSSSIAGSIPLIREHDVFSTPPVSYPPLMRTSSLPAETEEEWRKRKEMQSLRRMEAKRRRSEKQKNVSSGLRGEVNLEDERRELNLNRGNWMQTWAREGVIRTMNANRSNSLHGLLVQKQSSQGSQESHKGDSSSFSEMENVQRSSSVGEAKSASSNQSAQEQSHHEGVDFSAPKTNENLHRTSRSEFEKPSKKFDPWEKKEREVGTKAMEDMPCVFAKGDGPNARTVEGILYKYGKGEEVRIMCICHGNFLSPAEFVKHAGGGDVDNPLRHIKVADPAGASFS